MFKGGQLQEGESWGKSPRKINSWQLLGHLCNQLPRVSLSQAAVERSFCGKGGSELSSVGSSPILSLCSCCQRKIIKPNRKQVRVYLSQTDNNCWEAKSQRIEKMLREMAVLQLILYIRIKVIWENPLTTENWSLLFPSCLAPQILVLITLLISFWILDYRFL